jgi:cytochrome c oxidase subunit III
MSSVSTTIAAHGHRPVRRNTRFGNGFLGVIFFLLSEVALFGSLIFAYLYLRRSLGTWPPPGIERLEVVLPAINTVVLISSGFFCHYAYTAIKRGRQRLFMVLLLLTIVFGAAFLSGQAFEYKSLWLRTTINHDIFGATFFTLTGLHGAHVSLGVLALIAVFMLGLRGRWTRDHNFAVHGVTLYWHFVDAVWVVLFAIFYLV